MTNSLGSNTVSILLGKPDGTFQTHVEYATGSGPSSVVSGDFNGDSKPDLAVTNEFDDTVSILLGNGDGTFQTHVDYSVGTFPVSVAVGDFNGDGKLDLAVANASNCTGCPGSVSILLGNGDGTFRAQVDYATGNNSSSVTVGDFNGDGKLDLAVANSSSDTVSILVGRGDGTFEAHDDYGTGLGSGPGSVTTGDFNGDGKLDLAVVDLAGVSILLGNGDGTFRTHVDYPTGGAGGPVITRDFNGDGKLDLAIPNSGCFDCVPPSVSVLLGNGDGTFRTHVDYETGLFPLAVSAGDFNGDGKLDLATVNATNAGPVPWTVSILPGKGDGTFQSHSDYATGSQPSSVATGDFNGDGNPDLAVANQNCPSGPPCGVGLVSVLLGKADGTFQSHVDYDVGSFAVSVAVGDFNGDGKLDLAVANLNCSSSPCGLGAVSILLGNGDGTFQSHVDYPTGRAPSSVVAGDFNGDGKLDLAVANSTDNTVSILLGRGDGTFQTHVDYATSTTPSSVTVGDFNGDGKLDLAVANECGSDPNPFCAPPFSSVGSVSILLGKGDGTFGAHVDYLLEPTVEPISVTTGDFNGDGKLDLAVGSLNQDLFNGTVSIFLSNGDGTFQTHVDYAIPGMGSGVVTGDFNGDGKLDVAAANGGFAPPTAGGVSILLGNGDGTFQSHMDYDTSSGNSLAKGDFNRDGVLDLAVANTGANTVSVLLSTPVVALFPSQLPFGHQQVGTTSGPKTVLLSNPSPAPLKVSSITVSGADAGDFAETNTVVLRSSLGPIAPSV